MEMTNNNKFLKNKKPNIPDNQTTNSSLIFSSN